MINKVITSYQKFLDENVGNGPFVVFFIIVIIILVGLFLNGYDLISISNN